MKKKKTRKKKVGKRLLKKAHPIIEKIARDNRRRGAFAYYTHSDIEQEVWILCLDALGRYNPDLGSLENFLRSHVSNRLKNLKRDKYFRPEQDAKPNGPSRIRMNLINAIPLGGGDVGDGDRVLGSSYVSSTPEDFIIAKELHDFIVNRLPPELVNIFYKMAGGNNVRKPVADEVRKAIKDILVEWRSDEQK